MEWLEPEFSLYCVPVPRARVWVALSFSPAVWPWDFEELTPRVRVREMESDTESVWEVPWVCPRATLEETPVVVLRETLAFGPPAGPAEIPAETLWEVLV